MQNIAMAVTAALLSLLIVHSAVGQLKWVEVKPSSGSTAPSGRRDAGIGYDAARNQVVIYGGRNGKGVLDDTWTFDLKTRNWTKVSDTKDGNGKVIPENRFSMVYGSKDNYFYVSTGEGKNGNERVFYNDINRFDFTSKKWEKLEPKTSIRPEKRYGAGGGIYPTGNGLYVTHGFAGERYSNTLKFVFATQKWEIKFHGTNNYNPAAPHARCLQSAAMSDVDELVMYGGCLGGGGTGGPCPSEDGWKYNGDNNEWTQLAQCATPRIYSAMAMIPTNDAQKRRVVLYGGSEKSKSVLTVKEAAANEIVILDPATNKWTRKKIEGDVPEKRFGNVMVTTPDGIIVFGGKGSSDLNDVWLLQGNVSDVDKTTSLSGCDSGLFSLQMLHGIFMFIGWGVLLQLGAFIARYFRHKDPWWFKVHQGLQVSGLLFAIAGFICAVMAVPFDHFKFAHGAIGLDIMIVGVLQPLNGFFRPHKFPDGSRSMRRIIWEWYHKLAGRSALILALINICLGLFLDVVPVAAWAVWYAYLGVLCLLYIVMEIRLRRQNCARTGSADIALEKK